MNRKEYNGGKPEIDQFYKPRYVKVLEKMDLLGIMDITTTRQDENGTIVWRLPIKCGKDKFIEVASFKTGYVRNQNGGYTNYQLNKRCDGEPEYFQLANGDYRKFSTRSCVLIPNEIDRLEYLIAYCLKNYYIKNANQVVEGKYVPKWQLDHTVSSSSNDFNGHRDRIQDLESQLGRLQEERDDLQHDLSEQKVRQDVSVIVNGHRYKVL